MGLSRQHTAVAPARRARTAARGHLARPRARILPTFMDLIVNKLLSLSLSLSLTHTRTHLNVLKMQQNLIFITTSIPKE